MTIFLINLTKSVATLILSQWISVILIILSVLTKKAKTLHTNFFLKQAGGVAERLLRAIPNLLILTTISRGFKAAVFFTRRMSFLSHNQQHQSNEGVGSWNLHLQISHTARSFMTQYYHMQNITRCNGMLRKFKLFLTYFFGNKIYTVSKVYTLR